MNWENAIFRQNLEKFREMDARRTFNSMEEIPELLISVAADLRAYCRSTNPRRAAVREGRTWLY
jgi:hypothetical protein